MAKKKYVSTTKSGAVKKTTFKPTKTGFKKKEVTKYKDGGKMVRKLKTTKKGTIKTKTRRAHAKKK